MTNVVFFKIAFCLLSSSFFVYSADINIDKKSPSKWGVADIQASNIQHFDQSTLPNEPKLEADLTHLLIICSENNSAILLNGDTFEPITRLKIRLPLHREVKYSSNGRFAYFTSPDGWLSKYDIYNLKMVAEVRAGINSRNLALSSDGKYAIVANALPHNIVILDAKDLTPIKVIKATDKKGTSSRVSAVYNAAPRYSFIVSLQDVTEVLEIPYSDKGGVEVFKGWAHDYRKDGGEGMLENWKIEDAFPIRHIQTADFLDDLFFDADYINLIGASRDNHNIQAINLDVKKKVATIEMAGIPRLGSGITWGYQGEQVFASSNTQDASVSVIDMENWQVIKKIKLEGVSSFIYSHPDYPYVWIKVSLGLNKEKIYILEKETLEIVKTIIPATSKAISHIEFTKNGKHVLLSAGGNEDIYIVYDANTFKETQRLPIKMFLDMAF